GLRNYGTLFIGKYSAEVFGDYTSGVNHTLPTNLAARYTGGLSVKDFLKFQTTLRVNKRGAVKMAPHAIRLAETEGLSAHALSADIRKK
ncbi:MAG: histidinol dehydrogenase, partial [Deltaproteobacteria bacterium]|nr:histidinol dehydrogenase [Deltaproteobacteria bacterium]